MRMGNNGGSMLAFLFFLVVFAGGAYAEIPFEGAHTIPQPEFLACAADADCIRVENDCANCCGSGTAINARFLKEFEGQIAETCKAYQGGMCSCTPDSHAAWNPTCAGGRCALTMGAASPGAQ